MRASATTPDFANIDTYLNQQSNLTGFFNNQTGTQIVMLGFPSWLDISNPSDQTLYAGMVKLIAEHFIAMGEPIQDYEFGQRTERPLQRHGFGQHVQRRSSGAQIC